MKLVITAIDHRKSLSLEEKADKVVDEVEKYLGDASEEDGEEALQETAFTLIQNAMERFKYTDPEIANLATEKLGFSKESKVRIHISAAKTEFKDSVAPVIKPVAAKDLSEVIPEKNLNNYLDAWEAQQLAITDGTKKSWPKEVSKAKMALYEKISPLIEEVEMKLHAAAKDLSEVIPEKNLNDYLDAWEAQQLAMDGTKAWPSEVSKAKMTLYEKISPLIEEVEMKLHDGGFAD